MHILLKLNKRRKIPLHFTSAPRMEERVRVMEIVWQQFAGVILRGWFYFGRPQGAAPTIPSFIQGMPG
jgi:hypothetical protein